MKALNPLSFRSEECMSGVCSLHMRCVSPNGCDQMRNLVARHELLLPQSCAHGECMGDVCMPTYDSPAPDDLTMCMASRAMMTSNESLEYLVHAQKCVRNMRAASAARHGYKRFILQPLSCQSGMASWADVDMKACAARQGQAFWPIVRSSETAAKVRNQHLNPSEVLSRQYVTPSPTQAGTCASQGACFKGIPDI